MAQKSEVFKQSVKHKGFFNYTDFYNFCYTWLVEEDYKVSEEEYTEKITGIGKEVVIKWVAKKKISDYFQYLIVIKWHILGLNDAEVETEGRKLKTHKGEVKLTVTSELEKDYENRWEDRPFWKFLRGVYDKYVIKSTADEYEDRLTKDSISFIEQAKSFLALEGKR